MRRSLVLAALLMASCFSEPSAADDATSSSQGSTSSSTSAADISSGEAATTSSAPSSSSSEGSSSSGGCFAGDLSCMCFPNGTCSDELECREGVCVPSSCGNEMVDPGEDCDDGNSLSGDGCSEACVHETLCFVGNFGGPQTALASFSINVSGGIQHRQTDQFVGSWTPSASADDESSIVARRRQVYLRQDNQVLPVEILADGTFGGTGDEVALPGLLGLGATPRGPGVIAASRGAGTSVVLNLLESDPDGGSPAVGESFREVTLATLAQAVVFTFHPGENVVYTVIEPDPFDQVLSLVTTEYDEEGFVGEPTVDLLDPTGSVRSIGVVGDPLQLLFTGVSFPGQGGNCSGLAALDPDGVISGDTLQQLCGQAWGIVAGISQLDPNAPVILASSDPLLETWTIPEEFPQDSPVAIAGGRHILRLVRPDLLAVGTSSRIATVELVDGVPVDTVDELVLDAIDIPDGSGGGFFQAAALVPCPDA